MQVYQPDSLSVNVVVFGTPQSQSMHTLESNSAVFYIPQSLIRITCSVLHTVSIILESGLIRAHMGIIGDEKNQVHKSRDNDL